MLNSCLTMKGKALKADQYTWNKKRNFKSLLKNDELCFVLINCSTFYKEDLYTIKYELYYRVCYGASFLSFTIFSKITLLRGNLYFIFEEKQAWQFTFKGIIIILI